MSKPIHIKPEVVKNVVVIRVKSISTDWEKYVVDIDPVPVDKPLRLVILLSDTQEKIRPKVKTEDTNNSDTNLDTTSNDCEAIKQEVVANGEDSETERIVSSDCSEVEMKPGIVIQDDSEMERTVHSSEISEDVLKSKGADDPDITLVIPDSETNTEIDSKTRGSDSEVTTYHAKPARVLTVGHYPEGYSGPRVVTDYCIGEAFPPRIPTVEEFFTMLRERELEYGLMSDGSDNDK